MARRQLVPENPRVLSARISQYQRQCPQFGECWADFQQLLIYHAEKGIALHVPKMGVYHVLEHRYDPPPASIPIFLTATYLMTDEKVLLLNVQVRCIVIQSGPTSP